MKTSYFYSPKHPSKICDIAIESVVNCYYREDIQFYSDIFSIIKNDTLILEGVIKASSPVSDSTLIPYIKNNIGDDYSIINNIVVEESDEEFTERTFSGIYLGYSCLEVDEMIPFEHKEARELTRTIYEKLEIPLKTQIHVNGQRLVVSLEHNYENKSEIDLIVDEFFSREDSNQNQYNKADIHHSEIRKNIIYKSGNSIIPSFYGPRAWYGETDFVGYDFLSNKRICHLIVRDIANDYSQRKVLNYCAVEIDFTDNNPVPIHFGIKGNTTGIHLENGTFFDFGDIDKVYPMYKERVLNKIKTGEIDIVEIAKWGFPNTNI